MAQYDAEKIGTKKGGPSSAPFLTGKREEKKPKPLQTTDATKHYKK